MPNLKVFDLTAKEVGEIELNEAIFGVEVHSTLMHRLWSCSWRISGSALQLPKPALWSAGEEENLGVRKELAVLGQVQLVHQFGLVVELCSDLIHEVM